MPSLIGKITKHILQKSAIQFEGMERPITAISMNSIARGVVFLFAAIGISTGLLFLDLATKVAEVSKTVSAIFLSISIGYLLYWLADVPSVWFAKMATKGLSRMT